MQIRYVIHTAILPLKGIHSVLELFHLVVSLYQSIMALQEMFVYHLKRYITMIVLCVYRKEFSGFFDEKRCFCLQTPLCITSWADYTQ